MRGKIFILMLAGLILAPVLRGEDELVFFVRTGDTARSLTEKFLVRPTAWERVVQYNYILKPGNLIRVPAELAQRDERAFLVFVSGETAYRPGDGRGWLPAVSGLILRSGDRVRTGREGGAVIRMGRDDQVVLRGETEVVFESTRGFLVGKTNRVTVVAGTVLASTRKSPAREVKFSLRAVNSEVKLIGTVLRVRVNPDGASQFEVLEGEALIETPKGKFLVGEENGISLSE